MTDKIKTTAKPGSLRKEMTKEEKEWLENFNIGITRRSKEHLKKICEDERVVNHIVLEETQNHNAAMRDITHRAQRVYQDLDPDQALDAEVQRRIDKAEAYVEERFTKPKIRSGRYSEKDYQKEGFPDEDGLIGLIDKDIETRNKARAAEEAKKIKQFPNRKEKK